MKIIDMNEIIDGPEHYNKPNNEIQSEHLKKVREETKDKFQLLKFKAQQTVQNCKEEKNSFNSNHLKSFGELSESVLKMRQQMDFCLGKQINSPLKKDLMREFAAVGDQEYVQPSCKDEF